MTTPTGLLRWGQSGRYSAWDDRVVLTALAGRRTGVVTPVRMGAAPGLRISIEAGWLAVTDAGDGTVAVITSPISILVDGAPGGLEDRTDELVAEISDPEAATWSLSVLPPGSAGSGIVLGWVHVPAGAGSSEEFELIPRAQDFSTGGAIPGPIGPPGPEGPPGPPGQATLIVGSFGELRTPDELPLDGLIPAGWDGPGRPVNDTQVQVGWSLIYTPSGELWVFVGEGGPVEVTRNIMGGAAWLNAGLVQGPPGPPGPTGPQGPPGPGVSCRSDTGTFTVSGAPQTQALSAAYFIPAAELVAGDWWELEVSGAGLWGAQAFRIAGRLDNQLDHRFAEVPAGQWAGGTPIRVTFKLVLIVRSVSELLTSSTGAMGQSAPAPNPNLNANAALVGNASPQAITPGAGITIGIVGGYAAAGQGINIYGSRLVRYRVS